MSWTCWPLWSLASARMLNLAARVPSGDPDAKGLVEGANGYLETSFLPGRVVHLGGGRQRPAGRLAHQGESAVGLEKSSLKLRPHVGTR